MYLLCNKCTLIFMKIDLMLGHKGILNEFLRTKILSNHMSGHARGQHGAPGRWGLQAGGRGKEHCMLDSRVPSRLPSVLSAKGPSGKRGELSTLT